jgi:hypothetical protein
MITNGTKKSQTFYYSDIGFNTSWGFDWMVPVTANMVELATVNPEPLFLHLALIPSRLHSYEGSYEVQLVNCSP